MQFNLDGFRTGDPELAPLIGEPVDPAHLPEQVDVLIVGCGPAGLTLAAQLSAFSGISTCIVDQKLGALELGQADGVACRTVEMFNAFGFAERVLREAYWVNETTFWTPGPDQDRGIIRTGRIDDTEPGLSEFPHVILNQARVHAFFLDKMRNSARRLAPHYGRKLTDLQIDAQESAADGHPVTVQFERTDSGFEGQAETIRARYVIGCDGARSAVRRGLGLELKGDSANVAWGVMDVLSVTDFPDIRLKGVINSADHGSIVLIPREGGYLARIYVELDDLEHGERVASRQMTVDHVIDAARKVLSPYSFDVREVAWWSVYEIGQRMCDRFDNLSDNSPSDMVPRVFIAGDACHTHSPKAGQGMNVSMQDAFNLGWKLAAVLEGRSPAQLLRTYSDERHAIARELIDFDKQWAAMLSAPMRDASDPDCAGVNPGDVQDYFVRHGHYTAGTATRYTPAILTGDDQYQHLATGFPIGKRFHSAPVIRLGDAKPMHLGHAFEADGRWRLLAFAGKGDPSSPTSGIVRLCNYLDTSPNSPVRRYTAADADLDSVIDFRAVFQTPHRELDLGSLPALLLPAKGALGLRDYEKMFCIDPVDDIYESRGVDRESGCLIVLRPDQYVAHVLPIDGYDQFADFFARFLKQA